MLLSAQVTFNHLVLVAYLFPYFFQILLTCLSRRSVACKKGIIMSGVMRRQLTFVNWFSIA